MARTTRNSKQTHKNTVDATGFLSQGVTKFYSRREEPPRRFQFLLLPHTTMLPLSGMIEPMRLANQLADRCLYEWYLLSEDGQPVTCSNRVTIAVDGTLAPLNRRDVLLVCSGLNGYSAANRSTLNILRQHDRNGGVLGGICTGAYTLARAGLLRERPFTMHWEITNGFNEYFPDYHPSEHIFEVTPKLLTCGGGTAAVDLALAIITQDHGQKFARHVADLCLIGVVRKAEEAQRSSISAVIGSRNPHLIRAVELMRANIEDTLSMTEISTSLHVSRRQIERLFKLYLGCSPIAYYRKLRLERGRALLQETNLSKTEVALACGFSNMATFSRLLRVHHQ